MMARKNAIVRRILSFVFPAVLAVSGSLDDAHAANIYVVPGDAAPQPERLDKTATLTSPEIGLTGPIVEGDSARLRTILAGLRATHPASKGPLAIVHFNSNGGDVYEGLNIGYLLREFEAAAFVGSGDVCLSACALAFLGGTSSNRPQDLRPDRRIAIGGQVAFHNFFINPDSPALPAVANSREGMIVGFDLARGGSALLVRYAAMMSIDTGFIARLLGRPTDMWDFVDRNFKFTDLASCPMTVARPALTDAEIAVNICNHAVGGLAEVDVSKAKPLSAHDARRWLLSFVQKNAAGLSLKGPLVSDLNNTLAGRDDRLVDALYDELRGIGVHLPDQVGKTFEVGGYSFGGYDMQCHVSLSPADPDRYDVAISSPAGLSAAFKVAPDRCRRLFLYDRSVMHNPPKSF
jgi:hypothetical protein